MNETHTVILRMPAVLTRTGLSKSSIYVAMRRGTFPRPVKLGVRACGWRELDIQNWLDSRASA